MLPGLLWTVVQERFGDCLLHLLARNHTGIPEKDLANYSELSSDAFKSFDDMLYSDLISSQNSSIKDIFSGHIYQKPQNLEEEIKQYAFINTKLFIDSVNISQQKIIPGNVYEVVKPEKFQVIDGASKKSKKIVIELTPPCDYSHKKKLSRYVAGYMCECPIEQQKLYETLPHTHGCLMVQQDLIYNFGILCSYLSIQYPCHQITAEILHHVCYPHRR